MEIPRAVAIETTAPYADCKFYRLEGKGGYWRRLKKVSKDSTPAVYDLTGLRTGHFIEAEIPPKPEQL